MSISTDPEHKFELALSLDELTTAYDIILSLSPPPPTTTPSSKTPPTEDETTSNLSIQIKWKSLGDRALSLWKFDLAKECFIHAGDLSSLLLVCLSLGKKADLEDVVERASECFFFFFPNHLRKYLFWG
jgi:coatomer subunit beta'